MSSDYLVSLGFVALLVLAIVGAFVGLVIEPVPQIVPLQASVGSTKATATKPLPSNLTFPGDFEYEWQVTDARHHTIDYSIDILLSRLDLGEIKSFEIKEPITVDGFPDAVVSVVDWGVLSAPFPQTGGFHLDVEGADLHAIDEITLRIPYECVIEYGSSNSHIISTKEIIARAR